MRTQLMQDLRMEVDAALLGLAIQACLRARAPDRRLDAKIALAVFPALADLPVLEAGIWLHGDGTRVRALLYSASASAARTLVPAGCWIEMNGEEVRVCGEQREWAGLHMIEPLAICIAALRARTGG